MSDVVERVARAIGHSNIIDDGPISADKSGYWKNWKNEAKAAIAALADGEIEEIIARAFICEYCGLMPKHVTKEDIEVFFKKDTSQTNGAAQALKVAIRAYLTALKEQI